MALNMCVSLTLNGSRFSPLISTLFRILSFRDDVSERCHADTASAIFVRNPQARKTFPHRDWQRRSWRCKLRCSWIWRYYFRWYLYKYYFVINTNIKYLILDTASNEVVMMNRRRPGPNICQMACGPDDCIFTAECYCNCCKMYCPGDEGYEPPPQWAPGPPQNPNINININGK